MKKALVFALLILAGRLEASSQIADPTKIPHYFGPYPNWANSPLTTVDANIQLTDTCGNGAGTGATAVRQSTPGELLPALRSPTRA